MVTQRQIEVGTANLIPYDKRPKGEHLLISRRGGQARTKAKSDAAKWKGFKERVKNGNIKVKDAEWIVECVENPTAMAADVLSFFREIKEEGVHPNQRIALLNAQKDIMKTVHGETIRSENTNVNYNIDVNAGVREAFLRRKNAGRLDDEDDEHIQSE